MARVAKTFPEPRPGLRKSSKTPVPFPFILDALQPLAPVVKPMFSGYAVYVGDKIVFMLRDRPNLPRDNGLWIVFSDGFELTKDLTRLRKEFPSLRPIELLNGAIQHWLIVPMDGPNFETEALHACDLALAHDSRLGRIPQSRGAKAKRR